MPAGDEDIAMTASPSASVALHRTAARYWTESRQPLAGLLFVTPLLVIYEAGVLALGPAGVRNGVDALLRKSLEGLGFSQYFLLPVLTVGVLLAWHYLTRRPWRVSGGVFYGMIGECGLLSICLCLLLHLQGRLLSMMTGTVTLDIGGALGSLTAYLGAGVYEELLFRLLLLSLLAWVMGRFRLSPTAAMVGAVLLSSLLFAAAHYVGPYGDRFTLSFFCFRTLAGIFFAVLFVYRGFGIAAGTHAGYDLLVGLAQLGIGGG
jgi:hypothetical protein